ncbi:MAG: SpoIIE family protein phosphatase [Candidatus Marinimicrobia bacterium]|nr:SpoIIE family protein phosphatase [Candidatus Neomarinimicrobiota bacterium]
MSSPSSQTDIAIRNLDALLEVATQIGAVIDLDELLELIVSKTTSVMDAERSSLFCYDPQTNELWSRVAEGLGSEELRFPAEQGIAGETLTTRKIINIPNAYEDARFNPSFDKATGFKTRSVLSVPLITAGGNVVGVVQVLNKSNGEPFGPDDEKLLMALGTQAAVAIQRSQLVQVQLEQQKTHEALRLAAEIQMNMLPRNDEAFLKQKRLEVASYLKPAKEVGGDFYDYFLVDENHLAVVMGDVSDKGIPAALFMAITKTLIKSVARNGLKPDQVLRQVNDDLLLQSDSGMFVTIFLGIIDISSGEVAYANGGHGSPYQVTPSGDVVKFQPVPGIALGVTDAIEFGAGMTHLATGNYLVTYTDGVNEAMDEDGAEYGYGRLEELLNQKFDSSTLVIEAILDDVDAFVQKAPQSDDLTVLVYRHL